MPLPSQADLSELSCVGGRVRGDVDSDGVVVVQPRAIVEGNVTAVAVVIEGEVRGDVRAALVAVGSEGRVFGRLTYGALRTALGSEISGQLDRVNADTVSTELRALVDQVVEPPAPPRRPPALVLVTEPAVVVSRDVSAPAANHPRTRTHRPLRWRVLPTAAAVLPAIALAGPLSDSSSGNDGSLPFADDDPAVDPAWHQPLTPWAPPPPEDEPILVEGAPLDHVYWSLPRDATLKGAALLWNIPVRRLDALNPQLGGGVLAQGTPVLVHRSSEAEPTHSVGRPSAGALVNGVPMPEGESWRLRQGRRNLYGTALTIATLTHALEAYGRTFPDAPPVRIGDISARAGGTLRQHKSHQTGRDVDVGFVRLAGRRPTKANFDGEKNWFLIRTLIDSGSVDAIFISERVQRWIREAALRDLPESTVVAYFQSISHEDGHTRHMHVRFACGARQHRCRRRAR